MRLKTNIENSQIPDGVYDISNENYHAASAISRSNLMLMNKSPYHFWYENISGLSHKKESTPSMILGSVFHSLLLEPSKFDSEFIVSPKIDRRTNKGKEEYELFLQNSHGKTLVTQDQYDHAQRMVSHVQSHENAKELIKDSKREQSIFWTDEETGLQFKSRPDAWSSKMIVDVKTCCDSHPRAIASTALKNGYYLQAGMAYEATKSLGNPIDIFVILACEKEAPFAPSIFILDEKALNFGIDQFHSLKRKLKECFDSGDWRSYEVQELSVPQYAISTEE